MTPHDLRLIAEAREAVRSRIDGFQDIEEEEAETEEARYILHKMKINAYLREEYLAGLD